MRPPELTDRLKREALHLGFDAVGVASASASALESHRENLAHWIQAGFAGELRYMREFFERRARLQEGFPTLRSMIMVAVSYSDGSSPAPEPATGRIARYAGGRDYHRAMDKRLRRLEAFIRAELAPTARLTRAVDTRPIQERALAERAGLGFFGKNTCLIRPKGGSYFFLGALLTDLELVPDEPIRWDCGNCTLCLEACPTGALTKPYELDARRCISYLTIEFKGTIDSALRPHMKDWIFGCDICQEVCPYNRTAQKPRWEEFQPGAGAGGRLPLQEILSCRTDQSFLKRFAGTPLMRAKREGLLRNAAIAAANSGEAALVSEVAKTLAEDPSPMVREQAAWALERLEPPQPA